MSKREERRAEKVRRKAKRSLDRAGRELERMARRAGPVCSRWFSHHWA